MEDQQKNASVFFDLMGKVGRLYTERFIQAQKAFMEHVQKAAVDPKLAVGVPPENPWQSWTSYVTDAAQRSVLFWDILRERGNNYIEHKKEGTPPLLAFQWEMISDGRTFEHPVIYALVRIVPPDGRKGGRYEASLHHRRSPRRARSRDRGVQEGIRGGGGPRVRASRRLRDLFPGAGAGTDDPGRLHRRDEIPGNRRKTSPSLVRHG